MIHIGSMKERTKRERIVPLDDPEFFYIPLTEKFGNKPRPLVKPGDKVSKYQLIAESSEGFSAKIHSPVSGAVTAIRKMTVTGGGKTESIIIKNDFRNGEKAPEGGSSHTVGEQELTPESILQAIEDAGITGLGGAEFPAAMKYRREGRKVRTFIINGTECEPYITADYALMDQRTEEMFKGICLADRILEAEEIIIAIEDEDGELVEKFRALMRSKEYEKFHVAVLPTLYPQGGELQLIKNLTGIEIKKGSIPMDRGMVVSNVGTVYAIYDAIENGRPLVERVITVSGEKAARHGNYLIKVGTPAGHVLRSLGIDPAGYHVIIGGPMMGDHLINPDSPLTKGSIGITVLEKQRFRRLNCIWCGYCVDQCPMRLMPMKYEEFYRKGRISKLEDYNINDCIECGVCEYVCPSNVPLLESIKKGKKELKERENGTDKKTL